MNWLQSRFWGSAEEGSACGRTFTASAVAEVRTQRDERQDNLLDCFFRVLSLRVNPAVGGAGGRVCCAAPWYVGLMGSTAISKQLLANKNYILDVSK